MPLEVRNLTVRYDGLVALRDVSLFVGEREIVTIIGANGAGKTTLLRSISGLVRISSGTISLGEKDLSTMQPSAIVKAGVAQVPEERHLFPYMSVKDNLRSGAFLRRDKAKISDDLAAVLSLFPVLGTRLSQNAGTLSGGEQQMLAISRALMSNPSMLLLDEPSLGLSPMMVDKIIDTILDINKKRGVGILLVEQNARLALSISTRGYVFETGHMELTGKSADLLSNEKVIELYLGGK